MKIDMTAPILDIKGEQIVGEDGVAFVLRTIVQGGLLANIQGDANLSGVDKARMFTLALAANEDIVDWKAEDIAFVKDRIAKVSSPLGVGRAFALLETPAKKG